MKRGSSSYSITTCWCSRDNADGKRGTLDPTIFKSLDKSKRVELDPRDDDETLGGGRLSFGTCRLRGTRRDLKLLPAQPWASLVHLQKLRPPLRFDLRDGADLTLPNETPPIAGQTPERINAYLR